MSERPYPPEGPEVPGGDDYDDDVRPDEEKGQLSEVQRLGEGAADTQISPEDATAGYPESESGEPDTAGSGPDAAPPENRRDNDMHHEGDRYRPGQGIDLG
jgi:hypothetical protein